MIIERAIAEFEDISLIKPSGPTGEVNAKINHIVGLGLEWAGIAAAIVAFFYLIFSGFMYLTAGGNADQAKKGLHGILNAAIGIAIISLSWGIYIIIRKTIN